MKYLVFGGRVIVPIIILREPVKALQPAAIVASCRRVAYPPPCKDSRAILQQAYGIHLPSAILPI